MTLLEIIRKNKFATATGATVATHTEKTAPNAAKVASVAVASCEDEKNDQFKIEMILAWLYKIGEAEEDHHLVLVKCKADPEALEYFYRHANGEYDE
ncbi:hypothetical protein [Nitrosomonas ureae]|uniref:Uncharacterized protein n=1 Tax=Nitrosomonas ureae TaxID=44577 RepID=A0A1H2HK98_9PROT|nr:hypothetical protein [Nitrosomonas ureae]ALQ51151.1 hypothetical protein ATY38_07890 [Nitrosomonas ureae]SDU32275.1 hypothetical protein SAMN05216406_15310 [Nitrosomonas ureae]